MVAAQTEPRRRRRAIVLVVLALAGAFWVARGPVQMAGNATDLLLFYGASRAWLVGTNPYTEADQSAAITEANPDHGWPGRNFRESLYPPTLYPILASVSWGDWPTARGVWVGVNVAAMGAVLLAGLRLSGRQWDDPGGAALLAILLTFGPITTAFNVGQLAVVVTALSLTAVVAERAGRRALGGVLLGLGIAIKPQLAGLFVAYWVVGRRWVGLGACVATFAAAFGIGVGRMAIADVAWADALVDNLRWMRQHGPGNPRPGNPNRRQLINLAYPLHAAIASTAVVQAVVLSVSAATAGFGAWALWGRRGAGAERDRELLGLSLLAVATLMVVHHRSYDAAILALPLSWALGGLGRGWPRWAVLGLCLVHALPLTAIAAVAENRGWIPPAVAGSSWWANGVLPLVAWTLPATAVILAIAAVRRGGEARSHRSAPAGSNPASDDEGLSGA